MDQLHVQHALLDRILPPCQLRVHTVLLERIIVPDQIHVCHVQLGHIHWVAQPHVFYAPSTHISAEQMALQGMYVHHVEMVYIHKWDRQVIQAVHRYKQ
jgi:hypothetical protein